MISQRLDNLLFGLSLSSFDCEYSLIFLRNTCSKARMKIATHSLPLFSLRKMSGNCQTLSSPVLGYCVEKDDRRWEPMCSHSLNGPTDSGLMMGKEECTSPSGYYELFIPVDKNLDCSATRMKDTNCKDLDVSSVQLLKILVQCIVNAQQVVKRF